MTENKDYKTILIENTIKCIDAVLVIVLLIVSWDFYRRGGTLRIDKILLPEFSIMEWLYLLLLALLWNCIFSLMHMNNLSALKNESWQELGLRVFFSVTIGAILVVPCADLVDMGQTSRNFILVFWGASMITFYVYRIILALILSWKDMHHSKLSHALIVGLNARSTSLSRNLTRPESKYHFLGFVDDNIGDDRVDNQLQDYDVKKPLSLICSLTEFEEYISKNHVDEVFVTLPVRSFYDEIFRIINVCTTQGIKTRLINDLFDFKINISNYVDENLSGYMIDYDKIKRPALQTDLKRIFDIVVSLSALIILFPVFLIIAAAIYFDDGSPVFFLQQRIGRNKRRFKLFKFRTMVRNAEKIQSELEVLNEVNGATFKITDDPRIIKVGKFLRKSSLDEIPQFMNVLIGNMSIVGPRPLPIRDFDRFYKNTHRRRFSIKPGITCLWQISGRNEIDFEDWMELDLQYIENWNLYKDFLILLKTIPVVLCGKGAK